MCVLIGFLKGFPVDPSLFLHSATTSPFSQCALNETCFPKGDLRGENPPPPSPVFFLARRGDSSNFIASSICMSNVLLHQQAALLRRPPSLASHCLTPALDPSPHYITPYRHCQLWEEEQLNPICLVSFFSFVCPYSNKVLNDNKSLGIQCTTSWYRLSPSHSALKSRFKKNSNHFLFIERDSANWFLWNFELSSRHVDASRTIVIDRKVEMDSSVSYFSLVGVNGMATTPVIKTRPLVRKEFID